MEEKRWTLSEADKKIGGVCGGIGAYFQVDATWIRLAAILLLLFFQMPVLAGYLLLWAILPKNAEH